MRKYYVNLGARIERPLLIVVADGPVDACKQAVSRRVLTFRDFDNNAFIAVSEVDFPDELDNTLCDIHFVPIDRAILRPQTPHLRLVKT